MPSPTRCSTSLFGARPRQVRARGGHARRAGERLRRQPAVRRAGISRPAEGRGAGRLGRHRLSLVRRSTIAGAQGFPRRLSEAVGRLSAASARSSAIPRSSRSRPASRKAGDTDTEKLVEAFKGLEVDGPFGPVHLSRQRPSGDDGGLVGRFGVKDGNGTMSMRNMSTGP